VSEPLLVELARVAAGLTQGDLARRLGKTQPFISQVERGERDIPTELLPRWSEACGVPESYFSRKHGPLSDAVSGMVHRRMKTLPVKPFHLATAHVRLTSLELDSLFAEVDVQPSVQVPEMPEGIGPVDAASAVRRAWRIPEGPLPNLVSLIESAGIPVVLTDQFHQKQSATSHRGHCFEWMIVLNQNHPASRRRFTLAHELGHICLQHDAALSVNDDDARRMEKEADVFAGALLMPPEDATRELRNLSFVRLVSLKQRWNVSIAFLIRQALDHDLIDARRRQGLEIELSSQPGGRRREPAEFPAEEPTLVRRLIRALEQSGLTIGAISDMMTINEPALRHRYLGEQRRLQSVPTQQRRTVLQLERPIP
jgi:Zn-dependent peptidase ImmA (M78 family)/DNA-binding XRE family transcriptional regulator